MKPLRLAFLAMMTLGPLTAGAQTWNLADDLLGIQPRMLGESPWNYHRTIDESYDPSDLLSCGPAAYAAPLSGCYDTRTVIVHAAGLALNMADIGTTFGNAVLPPHTVGIRGGDDVDGYGVTLPEKVVIAWVAPADGRYHIQASFTNLAHTGLSQVTVSVANGFGHTGGVFGAGYLDSSTPTLAVDRVLNLTAGKVVDFVVQTRSSQADTLLSAIQVTAVPEPSLAMLFGAGLGVLGLLRRRRLPGQLSQL